MELSILLLFVFMCCQSSYQVALRPTQHYNVEVYFVADYKALSLYLNEQSSRRAAKASMEADIDYFLTEVNKRFRSLKNLNIVVSKRKLRIMDRNVFKSSDIESGGIVNATTAINTFDKWLGQQKAKRVLNYDVAMLWTGFDLAGTSIASSGHAWIGTVCKDEKATSVVEYDGTYRTVVNTAHEIAHNLGASHDSGSSGFIMSGFSSPSSINRWDFSLCSSSDITGVLLQLEDNCLTKQNPSSVIPNVPITDKLNDPNAICSRTRGKDSYMCHSQNLYNDSVPKGDAMCKSCWCFTGDACTNVVTSDGLTCGRGKSCREGTCQPDKSSDTKNVDETCLYGDQKQVHIKVKGLPTKARTCAEFLDATSDRYCQEGWISALCCKTCKERSSGKQTCPYGDKSTKCSRYSPAQICWHPGNAKICCGTCANYKAKNKQQTRGRGRRSLVSPFILADELPEVEDEHLDDHIAPENIMAQIPEEIPYAQD